MNRPAPKYQATFNGFEIDSDRGVYFDSVAIHLPPKELGTLIFLVRRASRLVTRQDLIRGVWNGIPASDESIARCLSVIKSRLRGASPGADKLIRTEYGRGYRFVGNVVSSASYVCEEDFVSEESFSALIDVSPDLIVVKDGAGRWLSLNRTGIALYGLDGKPWQGKCNEDLAGLLPEDCREDLQASVSADLVAWERKEPVKVLETLRSPAGGSRLFEMVKSPLFNEDGSRKLLLIIGREVTEFARQCLLMSERGNSCLENHAGLIGETA